MYKLPEWYSNNNNFKKHTVTNYYSNLHARFMQKQNKFDYPPFMYLFYNSQKLPLPIICATKA